MNHWTFVTAAYAVALAGTTGLLAWAWASMRRAEAAADRLSRRHRNPSPEAEGLE